MPNCLFQTCLKDFRGSKLNYTLTNENNKKCWGWWRYSILWILHSLKLSGSCSVQVSTFWDDGRGWRRVLTHFAPNTGLSFVWLQVVRLFSHKQSGGSGRGQKHPSTTTCICSSAVRLAVGAVFSRKTNLSSLSNFESENDQDHFIAQP